MATSATPLSASRSRSAATVSASRERSPPASRCTDPARATSWPRCSAATVPTRAAPNTATTTRSSAPASCTSPSHTSATARATHTPTTSSPFTVMWLSTPLRPCLVRSASPTTCAVRSPDRSPPSCWTRASAASRTSVIVRPAKWANASRCWCSASPATRARPTNAADSTAAGAVPLSDDDARPTTAVSGSGRARRAPTSRQVNTRPRARLPRCGRANGRRASRSGFIGAPPGPGAPARSRPRASARPGSGTAPPPAAAGRSRGTTRGRGVGRRTP